MFCESLNSHLIFIKNQSQIDFILNYWIDLKYDNATIWVNFFLEFQIYFY